MSSYKPSRATPKVTTKSRYNPLNYNKKSIPSNPQPNCNNNNNINSDSDLSSHSPIYTTHTLHKKRITPPQPQPINNANESNQWNFGVGGLIKSVWSNVVKPVISNDNNTSEPQSHTSNTPTTPLNNEMESTDTVELLDNEALAECVLEIVESDKKNDTIPSTPKKNKKNNKNNIHVNTYFEDLLQGNLTPNNNKNELLNHINKSVVKDNKRQLTPNNSPNPIQPTRKRQKTNDLPIGVVRSKTHTNVTHALQQGVNMIREHNSPTNTPQPQRKRSRKVFEEIEMNIKEEEEPPMKKIKVITPPTTPILSQETVDNEEVILTPDSPISKRHCRLNNIYEHEKNNKLPIVSVCCSIKILNENKQRYLKVYKQRLERIYSIYNMKNKNKINEFMDRYGGDCDKLHELYVKICNKYDLIALDKYNGQMEYIATNEMEISKEYKPPIVKGIDLSLIMKEKEVKPLETRSSESSVLTQENIHRHDANSKGMNTYNCDSDSRSDGTYSTFQTPRTFKDIETQSNKSETLNVSNNNETNKNGFFTQPIEIQSKKTRSYDSISMNDIKQSDNSNWMDQNNNNNQFVFNIKDFDNGGLFTANDGFTSNNNTQNNIQNNINNSSQFSFSNDAPMKFCIPDSIDTNNNTCDNKWNNNTQNNTQNNTFNNNTPNNQWNISQNTQNNTPNNTSNNQWNNNMFSSNNIGNNMGNNMRNNSFSFSDNQNDNLNNNNWNNNNNNQFTFGNNNNNISDNISRSGSVSSIDNSFFNQTPTPKGKKKRPIVRARRRNK